MIKDFGANVSGNACHVRYPDGDCSRVAEFTIEQNRLTDRRVCAICLVVAVEFILDRATSTVVRKE